MTYQATETRTAVGSSSAPAVPRVDFRVHPSRYRHWRLSFDGPVATVTVDVEEQSGLVPGDELKLNSYDLATWTKPMCVP